MSHIFLFLIICQHDLSTSLSKVNEIDCDKLFDNIFNDKIYGKYTVSLTEN